jgi:hypothetical protein
MLHRLVEMEEELFERISGAPGSGLRWFARLDIGVLHDQKSGRFSYWMNEIERGHCTGLFSTLNGATWASMPPELVLLWQEVILDRRVKKDLDAEE